MQIDSSLLYSTMRRESDGLGGGLTMCTNDSYIKASKPMQIDRPFFINSDPGADMHQTSFMYELLN